MFSLRVLSAIFYAFVTAFNLQINGIHLHIKEETHQIFDNLIAHSTTRHKGLHWLGTDYTVSDQPERSFFCCWVGAKMKNEGWMNMSCNILRINSLNAQSKRGCDKYQRLTCRFYQLQLSIYSVGLVPPSRPINPVRQNKLGASPCTC